MNFPSYGYAKELPDLDFEKALERATACLAEQGFGILTQIDVQATLKKKLDVEHKRYIILGACNPGLAHKGLQAEPFLGLLLPCNVVVTEREGGGSVVVIAKPKEMFRIVENPSLAAIVEEADRRLRQVLESL